MSEKQPDNKTFQNQIPPGFAFIPGISELMLPKEQVDLKLEQMQKSNQITREARRAAYGQFFSDLGIQMSANIGGSVDKPTDEISYKFLRDVYERSAIDRIIINARLMQIKRVARVCMDPKTQVGFKVVHKDHYLPDFVETDEIKNRCKECEEVILHPNPHIHPKGFKDFFVAATNEQLVIDRVAMVIFRDRVGRPIGYHIVDGSSIKPRADVLWPWVEKNLMKYTSKIDVNEVRKNPYHAQEAVEWASQQASEDKGFNPVGIDLTRAAYVQEVDGQIVAGWTEQEMAIDITNPSVALNRLPYGAGSLFQQSLEITAAWINAWQYNEELFRTNYPESLLMLFGDYDPNGLEAFKRQLYGEAGQGSWQRMLTIPADPEFKADVIKLRDTPKDMLFSELLRFIINLKTAAYRMNPNTINFSIDKGGHSTFNEGNQDDIIDLAQEEGFNSILENMAEWLTTIIVQPRYDDLTMVWQGLKKEDETKNVELRNKKVSSYMTINEGRAEDNLDPLIVEIAGKKVDVGQLPANATIVAIAGLLSGNSQQQGDQIDANGNNPLDDKAAQNGDNGPENEKTKGKSSKKKAFVSEAIIKQKEAEQNDDDEKALAKSLDEDRGALGLGDPYDYFS